MALEWALHSFSGAQPSGDASAAPLAIVVPAGERGWRARPPSMPRGVRRTSCRVAQNLRFVLRAYVAASSRQRFSRSPRVRTPMPSSRAVRWR